MRRRGGTISVDLYLFVLFIIQTSQTNLKFNDFKKILKNNALIIQIFYNLQNHPTFRSEERLVNLARGRECFVCLYTLLVKICVLPPRPELRGMMRKPG